MVPLIKSGSRVAIEPVYAERIEVGDIVAVRVRDSTMLHLVKAIDFQGRRVEISGTSGIANGWTQLNRVCGICTQIEGRPVPGARTKVKVARKPWVRGNATD